MTTGRIGVAISTTGDEHRLALLERCVRAWCEIEAIGSLFVTVDGDEDACDRVTAAVYEHTGSVYRVGQPRIKTAAEWREYLGGERPRVGVAVSKNTGIELLMDTEVDHLFLCDDDTWPLYPQSLWKHINMASLGDGNSAGTSVPHSMVCWGRNRLESYAGSYATWKWPRGVMLYQTRRVIERVGGMVEAFGPGGHEHVEWSERIHNAGLTPYPFCSPASYATRDAKGAAALWHCEDMPRPGENVSAFVRRKEALTSVRTKGKDWKSIDAVLARQQGSSAFVPYAASDNGRASATLCQYNPSLGAEESK